jgi:Tfp pilus assembly protein PilF/cold shock CspA family protein
MKVFNLGSRILLFSICTSLEYDLKKYIASYDKVALPDNMIKKAKSRNMKINEDVTKVLDELDLGDFILILRNKPHQYSLNVEKVRTLEKYFEKIIPVRNRVMHTRPLELGDRSLLLEVIEEIDDELVWFNWSKTLETKDIINNNPSELLIKNYREHLEYGNNVFHNLPEPEFDDTGYVGRRKELREISSLLLNNKNQVITIVGNGGIGKTALAVKILYELIDDPRNIFEAVVWISLKTRTLSSGDFVSIEESVNSIHKLFKEGEKNVVSESGLSSKESIINFMDNFNTLLVLDNLETISSDALIDFLKAIAGNSKILITSRHGIGELEYRYVLEGLDADDALIYFRELSKYYGLNLHKQGNKVLSNLIKKDLYSNPLSIKWYLTGVYNGISEASLISNKDELIEFCMSNVFEKLSVLSKQILQLFLINSLEMVYGEIDYYLSREDKELRIAMNELLSTNMIKHYAGKYELNDMAKDYLTLYHKPTNEFLNEITKKKRELDYLLQDIKVRNENDPFNPRSLCKNLESQNRKLASYYLTSALEHSHKHEWEEAIGLIKKAESIEPNYFEVYKIKAFVLAEKNDFFGARTNYNIALDKCDNDLEKATILYLYSIFFVIRNPDLEQAYDLITEASSYVPDEVLILLEKARICTYLGKFQEAKSILVRAKEDKCIKSERIENIYASRYAELMRRKAAEYHNRDIALKIACFKEGIREIEDVSKIDIKTYIVLAKILRDISYLYFDPESMELLCKTLEKHSSYINSITHSSVKRIKENITRFSEIIRADLRDDLNELIRNHAEEAKMINDPNKGIVTALKQSFGFIANSVYPKGIYFHMNNAFPGIKLGERVNFQTYDGYKGTAAKNVRIDVD